MYLAWVCLRYSQICTRYSSGIFGYIQIHRDMSKYMHVCIRYGLCISNLYLDASCAYLCGYLYVLFSDTARIKQCMSVQYRPKSTCRHALAGPLMQKQRSQNNSYRIWLLPSIYFFDLIANSVWNFYNSISIYWCKSSVFQLCSVFRNFHSLHFQMKFICSATMDITPWLFASGPWNTFTHGSYQPTTNPSSIGDDCCCCCCIEAVNGSW